MDKMLERFLGELKISETDYPLFEEGKLTKMSFLRGKEKYVATITFPNPIDFKVYEILKSNISNFKFKCDFLINVIVPQIFQKVNRAAQFIWN